MLSYEMGWSVQLNKGLNKKFPVPSISTMFMHINHSLNNITMNTVKAGDEERQHGATPALLVVEKTGCLTFHTQGK